MLLRIQLLIYFLSIELKLLPFVHLYSRKKIDMFGVCLVHYEVLMEIKLEQDLLSIWILDNIVILLRLLDEMKF